MTDSVKRIVLGGDVELHYLERGTGQPLVLLHGGMADLTSWGPQIDSFSRSFRVIAYSRRYNFPNHNNPPDAELSAYSEANDLAALIEALQLGPPHLIGTSYGALTALAFATARPQDARSLVLAEPPLHRWLKASEEGIPAYDSFMSDVWIPAGVAFKQGLDQEAMRLLFEGCTLAPPFDMLSSERQAEIMRNAPAMRALALARDPFPDVPRSSVAMLTMPVLLIRGEHAVNIHRLGNIELARVLTHAESIVLEGAGHGSPRERPEAFCGIVEGFLAKADKSVAGVVRA